MRDKAAGRTWGTYLATARKAAGLSKVDLARAANVGRATVFRWENGESRPEQAELVTRVAEVLGVELDEALAAAGLRPTAQPPDRPERQEITDPDLRLLAEKLTDPRVSVDDKALIKAQIRYLATLADRLGQQEAERTT